MGSGTEPARSTLAVEARGVGVRYGEHPALDGLDLAVAEGEIVGILGPNGAGKTSLLRLLATGRRPTAGTLRILGQDALQPSAFSLQLSVLRRQIGVAGDDAVHADAVSGRDNALLFGRLAGLTRAEAAARVDELLGRFGLETDAPRLVAHYSLGMRRKLLLLEALVHAPRLVVLDEPTLGLDRQGRDALHGILRERAAAGTAVVLASNDPVEPQRLCDRVVFLHRGRAVLEGEPAELIQRLGGEARAEVRRPDLGDVFLAATGEEFIAVSRQP